MLKTRIVTASLLFAAFYCALFYLPAIGWVCVSTAVAAAAFWEWGGLIGQARTVRLLLVCGCVAVCGGLSAFFPAAVGLASGSVLNAWHVGKWLYLPAAGFWLLVAPVWLKRRWSLRNCFAGCVTGLVVILPAWMALVQLRQIGAFTLLAVVAIVWLADIAAYFCGRTWGRHKLAPSISPGKTWEGALGATVAVIVYGLLLSSRLPDVLDDNPLILLAVLTLLAVISILGDLFESLLKRQVGVKDSSHILPGHGGVLDRIDSLTSTLPLVTLIWFGTNL